MSAWQLAAQAWIEQAAENHDWSGRIFGTLSHPVNQFKTAHARQAQVGADQGRGRIQNAVLERSPALKISHRLASVRHPEQLRGKRSLSKGELDEQKIVLIVLNQKDNRRFGFGAHTAFKSSIHAEA